jgi:hypothetical protein
MTRRLVLALLLALVLPLAQVAAAAHELSHVKAALQHKSSPAGTHCDLCVAAAAVTGGGAAAHSLVVLHAPAVAEQPSWAVSVPVTRERPVHFLSRAPPFLR